MSDEEKPLEFSARDLMPDWAQETPSAPQKDFSKRFAEEDDRRDRRGGRGDDRRGGSPGRGDRRDSGNRGGGFDRDRPRGDRPGGERREGGDRRGGGGDRRFGDRPSGDRGSGSDRDNRDRPREELPAVGITAAIEPSGPAIEGLTRHIRETFRSFPVSDLAKMILEGRERYRVRFTAADPVRLYQCQVDGSVWLTREEAISYLLSGPALETYYVVEDVEVDAPAGNFTVIAVCGMSGTLLGPPNHHEYQRNIARLHRERFSDMSLERFKSRIRMENGEEILEKWKEQVSRARQYRVRSAEEPSPVEAAAEETTEVPSSENEVEAATVEAEEGAMEEVAPAETETEAEVRQVEESGDEAAEAELDGGSEEDAPAPAPVAPSGPVLKSIEEVARHFRQHFADEAVRETSEAVVSGNIPGRLLSPGLLTHLRQESEKLRRGFPLPLIQQLCRDFEQKGLKFFKRGKKSLHVAAVRPKALDESVNLTESIRNIIDFIKSAPRPNVAGLLEALVPGFKRPEGPTIDESAEWSDAARAVLKDLRWLTAEGYVLEFADTGIAIGRPAQENPAPAKTPAKEKPKSERPAKTPKPEKEKPDAGAPVAGAGAVASDTPVSISEEAVDAGSGEFADLSLGNLIDEERDPDDPCELPDSVDPVETF